MQRSFWLRGIVHAALLAVGGFLIWQSLRAGPVEVTLEDQRYQVSGPHGHQNLAVYLIHSDRQDSIQYITLQEGLEKGLVKVSEKQDSTVNELQIDNQSDQHLFLQEGDRVTGGKQDRTIYASHVVPPKSGPQALPAFCVEPSRWSGGGEFKNPGNAALAPQEVRFAAKYLKDQGEVWANVARQREALQQGLRSANLNYATTSLNEALDAAPVKQLCDDFAASLGSIVQQHPSAVGVVIVINGRVEEVNVYPNHGLLAKQYPRLVQSYALQAVTDKSDSYQELSALEVARLMTAGQQGRPRRAARETADLHLMNDAIGLNPANQNDNLGAAQRGQAGGLVAEGRSAINADNQMRLYHGNGVVGGKTEYQGKTVHFQLIRREPASPAAQAAAREQQRNQGQVQQEIGQTLQRQNEVPQQERRQQQTPNDRPQ